MAYGLHLLHDVGGENKRFVFGYLLYQVANIHELVGIQACGRLIQDHQSRIMEQCPCNAHPLTITFGKLPDFFVLLTLQACFANHLLCAASDIGRFHAVDASRKFQKLTHIAVQVEGIVFGEVANLSCQLLGICQGIFAQD